jgi:hypothetical protein
MGPSAARQSMLAAVPVGLERREPNGSNQQILHAMIPFATLQVVSKPMPLCVSLR